jgi:hypothetical protein
MLTETDMFVDKTLFIKSIIDTCETSILLIRPRRWGKSSNMNILFYFLSKKVDQNGDPLPFHSNQVLFEVGKFESETLKPL